MKYHIYQTFRKTGRNYHCFAHICDAVTGGPSITSFNPLSVNFVVDIQFFLLSKRDVRYVEIPGKFNPSIRAIMFINIVNISHCVVDERHIADHILKKTLKICGSFTQQYFTYLSTRGTVPNVRFRPCCSINRYLTVPTTAVITLFRMIWTAAGASNSLNWLMAVSIREFCSGSDVIPLKW